MINKSNIEDAGSIRMENPMIIPEKNN